MMRNNMHFMGNHPGGGFGHGPMHGPMHGPGFGPMHGPMRGPGFGPGFYGIHHAPRPVRPMYFGRWFRPWPRYSFGYGLGCLGPFLVLMLIASAFGCII